MNILWGKVGDREILETYIRVFQPSYKISRPNDKFNIKKSDAFFLIKEDMIRVSRYTC